MRQSQLNHQAKYNRMKWSFRVVGKQRVGRTTDVVCPLPSIDRGHPSPHYFWPKPPFASLFVSELGRRRAPAGCFELFLVITYPFCLTLVHSSADRGLHAKYFGGKWIFFFKFFILRGERLQNILALWLIWFLCLICTWMVFGAVLLF